MRTTSKPARTSMAIFSTSIVRILAICGLALALAACGGGDGGGGGDNSTATIPAPGAPTAVEVDDAGITVTWPAVAGESYNLYWGTPPNGAKLNTTPVTASPATFAVATNGGVSVWVTKVVNSQESAISVATYAGTSYPNISFSAKAAGPVVSASFGSGSIPQATSWELHTLAAASGATSAATRIGSAGSYTGVSDTLTAFVDSAGAPISKHYALVRIQTGTAYTNKNTYRFTATPALSQFAVVASGNSNYPLTGSALAATATKSYWTCFGQSTICSAVKSAYGIQAGLTGTTYQNSGVAGSIQRFVVDDSSNAAGFVYYISTTGFGRIDMSGVTAATFTALPNLVAIVQDATYVYVATATTVTRVAKAALVTDGAASTVIGTIAGLAGMAISGTDLYLATNAGVQKLAGITGGTPTLTTPASTPNAVTSLAADTAGGTGYFLLPDAAGAVSGKIYSVPMAGVFTTLVQSFVYGGTDLQFAGGRLAWRNGVNLYTLTLSGSLIKRHAPGPTALLLESDGTIYTASSSAPSFPLRLPAAYAYNSAAPGPATGLALTAGDEVISGGAASQGAEAYEWTKDAFVTSVIGDYAQTFTGLANGTAYTIGVRGLTILEAGTATSAQATPMISLQGISARPKNGSVDFTVQTIHPRTNANGRSTTLKIYTGTTTNVSTAGTPAATLTINPTAIGLRIDVVNLVSTNGALLYYTATLTDASAGSSGTSTPTAAANSEPWINAAAAATSVEAVTPPTTGDSSRFANVSNFLFWINSPAALRRDRTVVAGG